MQTEKLMKNAKKRAKNMSWADWLSIAATVVFVPLLIVAIAWMNRPKRERVQSTIVPQR